MKKIIYTLFILIVALTSCTNQDDISLFDKSADQRMAEAIAALKSDLVSPSNGRRLPIFLGNESITYTLS